MVFTDQKGSVCLVSPCYTAEIPNDEGKASNSDWRSPPCLLPRQSHCLWEGFLWACTWVLLLSPAQISIQRPTVRCLIITPVPIGKRKPPWNWEYTYQVDVSACVRMSACVSVVLDHSIMSDLGRSEMLRPTPTCSVRDLGWGLATCS